MAHFIPVKFTGRTYPSGITSHIDEVAAHFAKDSIKTTTPFSLHTEYSAGIRKPSSLTQRFPIICDSYERGIPLLWTSEAWAAEFASFVRELCKGVPPTVLEIHPPYKTNSDWQQFFQRFAVFEAQFRQWAPETRIVLENRTGNMLGKQFLFSTYKSFITFSDLLDNTESDLRIAFDVPQILTAHHLLEEPGRIVPLLEHLKAIRHNIQSIHIWGCNPKAHWGDINTMFNGDQDIKRMYLTSLYELLDDGIPRYLVPEDLSSQADFVSIITDLLDIGFTFADTSAFSY